ncbi:RNA-binding domain-containing protein [Deinococcus humi]|uniref:Schlafen AlbA-2 domain-containing protein n=1 Tax=Deinococcus humi TaxID=662880 RepID=A0A7W8NHJ7_9DEIO|nr:RNA-binding domain-containing protein [Deinococcus humi]MBB5365955.1 hypothetical protein [Deinococcus humi]GGO41787.1 hypothetical protein GCM10008949_53040 [Deinococcus humi]
MTQPNREQEAAEYRINLLRYPNERPDVDYKAAMAFQKREPFGIKLIKHIIAFANGGGGTIIIGFKEDGNGRHLPDDEMTPDIAGSYDPTVLTPAVNEAVRGSVGVRLQIHKEILDDVTYPIITVESFQELPYFCAVDRNDERGRPLLKQGALYIRSNEASSVELATPDDWLRLLEVAVTRRQDDLLIRFGALIRQFGLAPQEAHGASLDQLKQDFQNWVEQQKAEALRLAIEGDREILGSCLFAYGPVKPLPTRIDSDLLKVMQEARRPNTGWPIGLIPYGFRNPKDRLTPVDEGLRTVIGLNEEGHYDYWLLTRSGAFFLFRNLEEDETFWGDRFRPGATLSGPTVVWRIAEALDHCIALYRSLGVAGEAMVFFEVEYDGLTGRTLTDDKGRAIRAGPATRKTTRFLRTASLDQMVADADGIVLEAVREIVSVFQFFDVPPAYVARELQEYRNSNVSG